MPRIAECRVDDDRQADGWQSLNPEMATVRGKVGEVGAEREHAAGDEDEAVELHACIATADERKKEIKAGGEVD